MIAFLFDYFVLHLFDCFPLCLKALRSIMCKPVFRSRPDVNPINLAKL